MISMLISLIIEDRLIKALVIFLVLDLIFGVLRAIRERKVNSGIGIDGMIRKVGMMISIIFFVLLDYILEINLIGFIPEDIRTFIKVDKIGVATLFNLLFIVFESLSILKNMIKCKLPIPKKLQLWLEKILKDFTTELKEGEK